MAVAYVVTHAARPPVERIDLGGRDTDVRFRTSDGLRLHGSYVPSRNGAAVIVAFGRKGSQPHARMLARHGYGVLIFDRRGEGRSDGDPNSYAWNDGELDLRAAVDFLRRGRTWTPAGSGAWACPWAARPSSRPPRTTAASAPWSARAPARARSASCAACPGRRR